MPVDPNGSHQFRGHKLGRMRESHVASAKREHLHRSLLPGLAQDTTSALTNREEALGEAMLKRRTETMTPYISDATAYEEAR